MTAENDQQAALPESAPKDSEPEAAEPEGSQRMTLLEHLQELRLRLRNSAIVFVVALIGSLIYAKDFFVILTRPIQQAMFDLRLEQNFVFTSPTEAFWCYFKLAIVMSILVASPLIFWELWKFIAPGLYRNEKRLAGAITGATALCFIGGTLFGYFLITRTANYFLIAMTMPEEQVTAAETAKEERAKTRALRRKAAETPQALPVSPAGADKSKPAPPPTPAPAADADETLQLKITPMLRMSEVSDFQLMMLLGCGAAFELPVVLSVLGMLGIITAISMWRFNRYALVLSAVVGGVLTPSPDVISQLLLAGPLFALYNISIIVVWFIERARRKKIDALETAPVD